MLPPPVLAEKLLIVELSPKPSQRTFQTRPKRGLSHAIPASDGSQRLLAQKVIPKKRPTRLLEPLDGVHQAPLKLEPSDDFLRGNGGPTPTTLALSHNPLLPRQPTLIPTARIEREILSHSPKPGPKCQALALRPKVPSVNQGGLAQADDPGLLNDILCRMLVPEKRLHKPPDPGLMASKVRVQRGSWFGGGIHGRRREAPYLMNTSRLEDRETFSELPEAPPLTRH